MNIYRTYTVQICVFHQLQISWKFRTRPFCEYQSAAAAKSHQSCLTLCDPVDGSPPSSPVPGILQARTLEWVAISFSNAWKWKVKVKSLSRVQLLATPWTAAYQAPPSMGFPRQEHWSGVPLPSPEYQSRDCVCGNRIPETSFISSTSFQHGKLSMRKS